MHALQRRIGKDGTDVLHRLFRRNHRRETAAVFGCTARADRGDHEGRAGAMRRGFVRRHDAERLHRLGEIVVVEQQRAILIGAVLLLQLGEGRIGRRHRRRQHRLRLAQRASGQHRAFDRDPVSEIGMIGAELYAPGAHALQRCRHAAFPANRIFARPVAVAEVRQEELGVGFVGVKIGKEVGVPFPPVERGIAEAGQGAIGDRAAGIAVIGVQAGEIGLEHRVVRGKARRRHQNCRNDITQPHCRPHSSRL